MIQLKLSKQGMREGVALTLPATPAEASEACAWFERLGISQDQVWQHENLYLKYLAVISVEQPQTIEDALHFTVRLDDYEFMPEDDYEYGQAVLRRHGATDEVLDRLLGYLNMEGLGRDARADDGVRKTEYGDLRRCSEPFPDITQQIELGGM